MIRIDVAGMSVAYNVVPVLAGTTFQVQQGEFVGLIGPNGCGKSTLLRAISGILKATQGTVLIDGRDVNAYRREELARIETVVTQESPSQFDFTVEEVVRMGRIPHTRRFGREGPNDSRAVHRAMERTGLVADAQRMVTELSGGERQRVTIARALAQEPSILLLDEPTAHLDVYYQVSLLDLLWELNRSEQLTILAVLHDLNLAAQYCDRLILLSGGKVYRAGKPCEVLVEETIREVYGVRALVHRHPLTDVPHVFLLSEAKYSEATDGREGSE